MDADIFTLCEYSKILENKLNIFGVFNTVNVKEIPYIHPLFFIAGRISFEGSDLGKGKYTIKIDIINKDGEKPFEPFIEEIDPRMNIIKSHGYDFSKILTNVQFKAYGRYSITIYVNDKPLKTISLYISPDI